MNLELIIRNNLKCEKNVFFTKLVFKNNILSVETYIHVVDKETNVESVFLLKFSLSGLKHKMTRFYLNHVKEISKYELNSIISLNKTIRIKKYENTISNLDTANLYTKELIGICLKVKKQYATKLKSHNSKILEQKLYKLIDKLLSNLYKGIIIYGNSYQRPDDRSYDIMRITEITTNEICYTTCKKIYHSGDIITIDKKINVKNVKSTDIDRFDRINSHQNIWLEHLSSL